MSTFNTLVEAQAFARANSIARYTLVLFTDMKTREAAGRGGWSTINTPTKRYYMDATQAAQDVSTRIQAGLDTDIRIYWTDETSNSPNAK